MPKYFMNVSEKHGDRKPMTLSDYAKKNPEGTFVQSRGDLHEYRSVNGKDVYDMVGLGWFRPSDIVPDKDIAAVADVIWDNSDAAEDDEQIGYYVSLFNTLIRLAPNEEDKAALRIFVEELESALDDLVGDDFEYEE